MRPGGLAVLPLVLALAGCAVPDLTPMLVAIADDQVIITGEGQAWGGFGPHCAAASLHESQRTLELRFGLAEARGAGLLLRRFTWTTSPSVHVLTTSADRLGDVMLDRRANVTSPLNEARVLFEAAVDGETLRLPNATLRPGEQTILAFAHDEPSRDGNGTLHVEETLVLRNLGLFHPTRTRGLLCA